MKPQRFQSRSAISGFIPTKAAIVLAIIGCGAGVLACEWHRAHVPKQHHGEAAAHHHKHEGKGVAQ